jgi:hypothetical protein
MAKGSKRKVAPGDVASNRYAAHKYNLLERLECGMVLQGTEVKSLRTGTVQIKDGFAAVRPAVQRPRRRRRLIAASSSMSARSFGRLAAVFIAMRSSIEATSTAWPSMS